MKSAATQFFVYFFSGWEEFSFLSYLSQVQLCVNHTRCHTIRVDLPLWSIVLVNRLRRLLWGRHMAYLIYFDQTLQSRLVKKIVKTCSYPIFQLLCCFCFFVLFFVFVFFVLFCFTLFLMPLSMVVFRLQWKENFHL